MKKLLYILTAILVIGGIAFALSSTDLFKGQTIGGSGPTFPDGGDGGLGGLGGIGETQGAEGSGSYDTGSDYGGATSSGGVATDPGGTTGTDPGGVGGVTPGGGSIYTGGNLGNDVITYGGDDDDVSLSTIYLNIVDIDSENFISGLDEDNFSTSVDIDSVEEKEKYYNRSEGYIETEVYKLLVPAGTVGNPTTEEYSITITIEGYETETTSKIETAGGEEAEHVTVEMQQTDGDGDGVYDNSDACPEENASKYDDDEDGCLDDGDGDGVTDDADYCPFEDATGYDTDEDGCIDDTDGDGIYDDTDACPTEDATGQDDDEDGCIDDLDSDGDGLLDSADSCPTEDATGYDTDEDGCIDDTDGDGVYDDSDSCPTEDATDQDDNGDGCIDVEDDSDADGIVDSEDACPTENSTGYDTDEDGCIDDTDGDGVYDDSDSCPTEDATGYDTDSDGCIDSTDTDDDDDDTDTTTTDDDDDNTVATDDECSHPFNDVDDHWGEDYICEDYENDFVDGKTYSTYDPNADVTRAEFAKMALSAAGYSTSDVQSSWKEYFEDVSSGDWFYSWVRIGEYLDMFKISGSYFNPNVPITRSDAVIWFARLSGETLYGFTDNDIPFTDVGADDPFAYAVLIAYNATTSDGERVISGDDGKDTFRPYDYISRAEAAAIIARAYDAWFK